MFYIYIDWMEEEDKNRLIELLRAEGIEWEDAGQFWAGIVIYEPPTDPEARKILEKYLLDD